ncbi:PTS fructose transporter subunit IIB [Tetragenococcus halophilus subsp. flandriensis]|uniref:mannose/fructose/sorbose PTS transporter subunit IIB n=1 Tax=Tetragenococcus halophilus TaxID=51669 RepID=UPI0023E99494|nr:mannose/fructose/sorbose PTS transporter subunit IIB [Tetragenococcus halophilus]GMA09313.1 PTS fructose transporter subunit IIB [Tetragenococcus halophilus subsp. flandriensis]
MDIRLARIDDRLIHGQVATVWAKEAGAQRIIVVSDEVADDKVRSTLVKQAAPPGVKANVVGVEKAVRVYNNPKYENETVFFLFTNPTEVLQMVEQDIPIETLNIGGMQYSEGRTQVTKSVSVDEKDVRAFKKLAEKGVKLDFRVVATDAKKDFTATLKEAGF